MVEPNLRWWLPCGLLVVLGWCFTAPAGATVWAEAEVTERSPYQHQSVIYTVRLYSLDNLQSVEITPPSGLGVAVEELDRGNVSSTLVRGRRYILNEYHYVLTPMRAELLTVGPARLRVKAGPSPRYAPYGASAGETSDLQTNPVELEVRALPPGVQLPLQYLTLKLHLPETPAASPDDPLVATVVITGRGKTGEQLPGIASMLKSEDFKVYPERPRTDWKLLDGNILWGRRIESFTLVPAHAGRLHFPAITLDWWDTELRKAQSAGVPARLIVVGADGVAREEVPDPGGADPSFMKRLFTQHALLHFVLPVGGGLLLAFLLGWNLGMGRRDDEARWQHVKGAVGAGLAPITAVGRRAVSLGRGLLPPALVAGPLRQAFRVPARLVGKSVAGVLARMPLGMKAWWCARCVAREQDPVRFCQVLRRFACQHLAMAPNSPLPSIADRIVSVRQRSDSGSLRRLFRDLDDALYARRVLDVAKWKQEFRRRFPRALRRGRLSGLARRNARLPELNP